MRFPPSTTQSIETIATGSEDELGRLVVSEFVTLDGVIEDPGGADGFERGVTHEGFAAAWPGRDLVPNHV
jgi:hypothetical protein